VSKRERFSQGELKYLLRARGEGDLARRDLVPLADDAGYPGADFFEGDVKALEGASSRSLFLTKQPLVEMLRADVVVQEAARLVLGKHDDFPRALSEALEHPLRTLAKIGDPLRGSADPRPLAPREQRRSHVRSQPPDRGRERDARPPRA
jgi:hypothetical protein